MCVCGQVSCFTGLKVCRLLKAHRNSLFPNYSKLKVISAHIEWTGKGTGTVLPFQSEDHQSSVDPVPQSPQRPDSVSYATIATSSFAPTLPGLITTSTSNPQPSLSTRPSSPPPVPQSPILYFLPSCFEQCPEPCRSESLSTSSASAPLASRQAVQQSAHDLGLKCPTPAPTSSFLALERSRTIQQLSGTPRLESQPESATLPFFSSSHAPSTSSSKTDDFIHRWVRSIGSDLDPNALSPKSPVDYRFEDEAAISGNDPPDKISDHRNSDQSRPVDDQTSEELLVIKAMHSLSGSSAFSDDEKARLLIHLCDYPVVAAAVPNEASSREVFYQDLLKQLDSE